MNYEEIIAQKDAENQKLKVEIVNLKHQLEQLIRLVYGRKSERFESKDNSNQLNLFEDVVQDTQEAEQESEKETITYERSKKSSNHNGRRLLENCSHLPVEEKIIDVEHSDEDIHIGNEVSEKLAFKPGKLYIIRTIRPKYKKVEEETIIIAPMPDDPISKCAADVSLLAHITVSKFVDHLP